MLSVNITISGNLDALPEQIEQWSKELAEQIPIEVRRIVDESIPSGKLYRRGRITKRSSKGLLKLGLQGVGKSRVITGTKIHRASAKGQPWAKDSGKAYKNITVTRVGKGMYRVRFVDYVRVLELKLNRPVLQESVVRAVRKIFNQ